MVEVGKNVDALETERQAVVAGVRQVRADIDTLLKGMEDQLVTAIGRSIENSKHIQ